MKTTAVSSLALVLVAALTFLSPARAWAADAQPRTISVDYVLALMDSGMDQKEIIHRIEAKNLSFRLAPGDIDRLREAGAGKNLIEVVVAEGVVLENREGAPSGVAAPPPDQGGAGAGQWGRPNRLGGEAPQPEATEAPPDGSATYEGTDANGEGIDEENYGGYGDYSGYGGYGGYSGYDYWPGYYGFVYSYGYPYPYYYYPRYYYPYRSYYYSYPYYSFPHHSFRGYPRGGGSWHGAPHGGGGGPRSSPRGGGSPRSSPRGSHHH